MSKSVKRHWQRPWAHTQWYLGHSGDLGDIQRCLSTKFYVVWLVTMVSMLILEFRGVLLRVGFYSYIALGSGLILL